MWVQSQLWGDPTDVKLITSIDDFPAADAWVITLETNVEYRLNVDISTNDRFVVSNNTRITTVWWKVRTMEYTWGWTMFTWVWLSAIAWEVQILQFHRIQFKCPNCKIFDISWDWSANTFIFAIDFAILWCQEIWSITDINFKWISPFGAFDCGQWFTFWNNEEVIIEVWIIENWKNSVWTIMFNFPNVGIYWSIFFLWWRVKPQSNESIFFFDPAWTFNSIIIQWTDLNWSSWTVFQWTSLTQAKEPIKSTWNKWLSDSTVSGYSSFQDNALLTTIVDPNTPVLINAVWDEVVSVTERIETQSAWKWIYKWSENKKLTVNLNATVSPVWWAEKPISIYVVKNWTVITETRWKAVAKQDSQVTVFAIVDVELDDEIEVFIENNSDWVDVTVTDWSIKFS